MGSVRVTRDEEEAAVPSVTELLLADHRRLHALLGRAAASAGVALDAYAAFRAGLLRHIAIEEKILFPAVKRVTGATPAWLRELRIDHAALTSLLVPTPDAALLAEIAALLTEHDTKEEGDGVYATCERLVGPTALRELAARAEALPPVRVAPHFDGPGVLRTRADAQAAAARMRPPKKT